jgi:hypothetical protein
MRAGSQLMDGLRDQLLARAGLAAQQHGGVGRADPGHELQHPARRGAAADEAAAHGLLIEAILRGRAGAGQLVARGRAGQRRADDVGDHRGRHRVERIPGRGGGCAVQPQQAGARTRHRHRHRDRVALPGVGARRQRQRAALLDHAGPDRGREVELAPERVAGGDRGGVDRQQRAVGQQHQAAISAERVARGGAGGAGHRVRAGQVGEGVAELGQRGQVALRAAVAVASGRAVRQRQQLARSDVHRDVRRRRPGARGTGEEAQPGLADGDLVAILERVARDRRAGDQGPGALVGHQRERAGLDLQPGVRARHRGIAEPHQRVVGSPDRAPSHRHLDRVAEVRTVDDFQAPDGHASSYRWRSRRGSGPGTRSARVANVTPGVAGSTGAV